MPKSPPRQLRSRCPINFSLEIFGDKWSLLIIRDIVYAGKRTHGEFMRSEERIATNILAERLDRLACQGIVTREADPSDARREIFGLTEKGLALIPLLLDLQLWASNFGPASVARSPALEAALKANRLKVVNQIIGTVRKGGFLFANVDWFPPRSQQHAANTHP